MISESLKARPGETGSRVVEADVAKVIFDISMSLDGS
jgi:hypothetical protein